MVKQTPFMVEYSTSKYTKDNKSLERHWARFSDEREARKFAKKQVWADVILTIGEGKGLIGQYRAGKPTDEFAMREWEFE